MGVSGGERLGGMGDGGWGTMVSGCGYLVGVRGWLILFGVI